MTCSEMLSFVGNVQFSFAVFYQTKTFTSSFYTLKWLFQYSFLLWDITPSFFSPLHIFRGSVINSIIIIVVRMRMNIAVMAMMIALSFMEEHLLCLYCMTGIKKFWGGVSVKFFWVQIFWVKISGVNLVWVKKNFGKIFGVKIFGWKFSWWKIFGLKFFLGDNFLGENLIWLKLFGYNFFG